MLTMIFVFLKHTIEENEAKKSRLDSRLVEVFEQLKDIQGQIKNDKKKNINRPTKNFLL